MGLRDITDRSAVLKALGEFDTWGRDAFLAKYGFGPARRFYLVHDGRRYDSKAVLGAAHGHQFPERGPLASHEFSGGEATTVRKLQELGFTIEAAADAEAPLPDEPVAIGEIIAEVLALQRAWSKDNTPAMQERARLVRRLAPAAVRSLLPPAATLPFTPDVEGQDDKARVPWVRVFSRSHSPSAATGWYVALLFAADGSAAYLALVTGTVASEDGVLRARSTAWLQERVAWARRALAGADTAGLGTDIALSNPGGMGQQYEWGSVFAFRYQADEDVDAADLAADLQHLLTLLSRLYDESASEPNDEVAPGSRPVHLLLKWNPQEDPQTVDKHKEVADRLGAVWWGSFTRGDRRIGDDRIAKLRTQLVGGRPTYAFLYRSGPAPALWRARVLAVTNQRGQVDEGRVPTYYGPDQSHSGYVLLADIEPADLSWVQSRLALASKPVAGSLAPALRNQTTPVYVVEIDDAGDIESDSSASEAHDHVGLTREWLAERTLWDADLLDEVLATLFGPSPQVILAGPPGTGKSWVAQAIARYVTEDRHRQWRLVQFHPGYSYESFIEGIRPVVEDGAVSFEREDGTVLRMATAARLGRPRPHVLVIDELNRANIPRVLGELMFLFEYRDEMVDLQYSQGFALPDNLFFIATMNTADRSIRSLDTALRRRFEIFECRPDVRLLEAFYAQGKGVNHVDGLARGFVALNEALEAQLDRHHTVGHTFFMVDEMTPTRLRRIWERKVQPLIEEYLFDVPDLAAELTMERFWPDADA